MKHRMHWNIISGMILFVLITSCGSGKKDHDLVEISSNGDTVMVLASSPICKKLQLQTITEQPFSSEFRTVGVAKAETERFAEIGMPFDGRITRAAVRLGSKVSAGQCLFEMTSSEFAEATKVYFQAVSEYNRAQANYKRKQTLLKHGIVAQREMEEAQTEMENAKGEKEAAEATLKLYKVSTDNLRIGQTLKVTAPISGEVVANNITPGQLVKADEGAVVTIADLSKMWVTAQIKEKYLGSVTMGESAEVYMDANAYDTIKAKVIAVGNMVDEETRSVQVILSCNNVDKKLKHGQFVSVHFMAEPQNCIVIPLTAIFQGENSSYVYVAMKDATTFVKRKVEIGTTSDDEKMVSIISGLQKGETIVAEGGLYLNN